MTKKGKTALIVIPVFAAVFLAAALVLLSNQFLIARVLEVWKDSLLVEVSNSREYRWIDRRFGVSRDYEYICLYVENPEQFARGQFFAALTKPGQEDSDPPGIAARRVFR